MGLSYRALQIHNGELHDKLTSKDKTIDFLKMKLKKRQSKKEEKEKYYEEQKKLQKKIDLQLSQFSTSLLRLQQCDKPAVPPAGTSTPTWGRGPGGGPRRGSITPVQSCAASVSCFDSGWEDWSTQHKTVRKYRYPSLDLLLDSFP